MKKLFAMIVLVTTSIVTCFSMKLSDYKKPYVDFNCYDIFKVIYRNIENCELHPKEKREYILFSTENRQKKPIIAEVLVAENSNNEVIFTYYVLTQEAYENVLIPENHRFNSELLSNEKLKVLIKVTQEKSGRKRGLYMYRRYDELFDYKRSELFCDCTEQVQNKIKPLHEAIQRNTKIFQGIQNLINKKLFDKIKSGGHVEFSNFEYHSELRGIFIIDYWNTNNEKLRYYAPIKQNIESKNENIMVVESIFFPERLSGFEAFNQNRNFKDVSDIFSYKISQIKRKLTQLRQQKENDEKLCSDLFYLEVD